MPRYFMQDTELADLEREMMAVPGFGRRRSKPVIEDNFTSAQATYEIGYPNYTFPEGDGSFVGKLVKKRQNRRNGINCFFDGVNGERYMLCVWDDHDPARAFSPLHSDVNILRLPCGTMIKARYRATVSGKTKWLEAEVLEVPA